MATEVFFNAYEAKDSAHTGIKVNFVEPGKQLGMLNLGDELEFVVVSSRDEDVSQIYKYTIGQAEALVAIDVESIIADKDKNLVAEVTPYTPPFRKEMNDGDGTKAEMIVRHAGNNAVQLAITN